MRHQMRLWLRTENCAWRSMHILARIISEIYARPYLFPVGLREVFVVAG